MSSSTSRAWRQAVVVRLARTLGVATRHHSQRRDLIPELTASGSDIWATTLRCWSSQPTRKLKSMCRNIKILFNFEPPATELEIRDASLQFVRKLSGFNVPSKVNEQAFERAVEEVSVAARRLISSLSTTAEPRNRQIEAAKAKARSTERFGISQ